MDTFAEKINSRESTIKKNIRFVWGRKVRIGVYLYLEIYSIIILHNRIIGNLC